MKKILITVVLIFTFCSLFAVNFTFYPGDNLFAESPANPYAYRSYMRLFFMPKASDNDLEVATIVTSKEGGNRHTGVMYLPYHSFQYSSILKNGLYVNMKVGEALSLCRLSLENVELELEFAGYVNNVFETFDSAMSIAYDGSYFFGLAGRLFDSFSLRTGLHHFSGHYGDELLIGLNKQMKFDYSDNGKFELDGKTYNYGAAVEYCRDNNYLLGLSYDTPIPGLRVYSEAELPLKKSWIRPFFSAAADTENTVDEYGLLRVSRQEGWGIEDTDEVQALIDMKGADYQGWDIHFGIDYTYPVSFGKLFASADFQFHQDGQNRDENGKLDPYAYKSTNPWDKEITVGGGISLSDALLKKDLSFEVYYHNGRFPSTQFFYKTGSFVYLGFSID